MKPRNKRDRLVLQLNRELPPVTDQQKEWLKGKLQQWVLYKMGGLCKCTRCGYEWKEMPNTIRYWRDSLAAAVGVEDCMCPDCAATLTTKYFRYYSNVDFTSMLIFTTYKGWQVIRFVHCTMQITWGRPTDYTIDERYQLWIDDDGNEVIMSLPYSRAPFSTSWHRGEPMVNARHNASSVGSYAFGDMFDADAACVYPWRRVTDRVKRNGWSSALKVLQPYKQYEVLLGLLKDPKMETLAKWGDIELLNGYLSHPGSIGARRWQQVLIAHRHGYKIHDVGLWLDLLGFLEEEGKDITSPHYICPSDLRAEHDRWQRKIEERRRREKAHEKAVRETRYRKAHERFAGLCCVLTDMSIRPLLTAPELLDEGEAMHHCVGTYTTKLDSLILSIRDGNDNRLETAEVNLDRMTVVQCRGFANHPSTRHKEIEQAVKALLPEIMRLNAEKVIEYQKNNV